MERRSYLAALGVAVSGTVAGCLGGVGSGGNSGDGAGDSSDSNGLPESASLETVTDGLAFPWAMAFRSDGESLLVTERDAGRLLRVDLADGSTTEIDGIPEVEPAGQGGLLDVTLGPDDEWAYLTYAVANDSGETTTRLGRGRLTGAGDDDRLSDFEVLYTAEPYVDSGGHYGSRVAIGPDGLLYMTVGDRQSKDFGPDHFAQDLSNDLGTTLRLRPDGSIPEDNPFVDDPDARDAIYSYGHRNAQGIDVHPETGAIWESEFGESDGDEINRIERGGNYGWPVADEGCTYVTGEEIGVSHDDRDDVIAPVFGWPCGADGPAPSGMTFYDGEAFPEWQGDLFVGGLVTQDIVHLAVDGDEVSEEAPLLAEFNRRIRDVVVGPDDALYVAVDAGDAPILRIAPK
ncbi:PQQ-dependent sugar dehydrogenase [Halonotius terrestris]|uniref:PQQ-dependent sugar dehydrogenase n=1 Tax=Halonotius terrestris TaxID=2487750 RepID=A0A8J8PA99_9EURY|nr:PQQ-dependent sugar dehydrogenase [Halonotius terrestris]TQQ82586.1 PQQ-dependent sugar dehydrogenase [Halonotius terrestris]